MKAIDASAVVNINRDTTGIPRSASVGATGCEANSLSFIPNVILSDDKNSVMLRASLEVAGVSQFDNGLGYFDITLSRSDLEAYGVTNAPENIANLLFLQSGLDLMRQHFVSPHFDYSPLGGLQPNQAITINGRDTDSNMPLMLNQKAQSINLTLKVINDLPADAMDFVATQWGHEIKLHSCMSVFNMAY